MKKRRNSVGSLNQLLRSMEGNCQYCGEDFSMAQRVSRETGLPIFEQDSNRGYFVVARGDEPGLNVRKWSVY